MASIHTRASRPRFDAPSRPGARTAMRRSDRGADGRDANRFPACRARRQADPIAFLKTLTGAPVPQALAEAPSKP